MDWTKIDIADLAKISLVGIGTWTANAIRKRAKPFYRKYQQFSVLLERISKLEDLVKIEQNRNRAALHIDRHPIFITNNEGELVYANPAWGEMTGMDERDALGLGYLQAIPQEYIQFIEKKTERQLKHPSSGYEEITFQHIKTKKIIKTMCRSEPVYKDDEYRETIGRLYIIQNN